VRLDLLAAPTLVLTRGGRVVAVAINDHGTSRIFSLYPFTIENQDGSAMFFPAQMVPPP
jgi:hypothetical protein